MPQKSKKTKKKDAGKRKQNLEPEKSEKNKTFTKELNLKGSDNFAIHFNHDELQEIKTVIKNKELSNLPLILAAAIANKLQIVKDLIQKGCHINETGPNHLTALMWAVKCKNLEIIDFLLANGADPTTKNDCGDNILFMALENKLWEEEQYITLWNRVKNVSFVDVDFMSKNGRNMVHTAIRREWKNVLDILIAGKANINLENANGTTPLMLASYLNHFDMVNALLQANADPLKQDVNGCTALCYAISCVLSKDTQCPLLVVEKLKSVFRNHDISFRTFFTERIDTILHAPVKQNKTGQTVLDMRTYLIHYVLRFIENGLKMILELDIFKKVAQAAENYVNEPLQMIKFLTIINEIMKYCECYFGTAGSVEKVLCEAFVVNGLADLCLTVFKMHGLNNSYGYDFISSSFAPILLACISHEEGKAWLNNNIFEVFPYYKMYLNKTSVDKNTNDIQVKQKIEKHLEFNKLINTIRQEKEFPENSQPEELNSKDLEQDSDKDLDGDSEKPEDVLNDDGSLKESKQEPKSNPKKTKRRAKALKAKIAKIKSAELAERLNQNGKKLVDQTGTSDTSIIQKVIQFEEPIMQAQEQRQNQDQDEGQNHYLGKDQEQNQNRYDLNQDLSQQRDQLQERHQDPVGKWYPEVTQDQCQHVGQVIEQNLKPGLAKGQDQRLEHVLHQVQCEEQNQETENGRNKPWSKYSAWEQVWLVDNSDCPLAGEFNHAVTILEHQFMNDMKDDLFNINFEIKSDCEHRLKREYEVKELGKIGELWNPDWKNQNLLPPTYLCTHKIRYDKKQFTKSTADIDLKEKPSEEEIKDLLTYTLNYLSGLLKKIIITYQKHWEQDKAREDVFMNDHGDVTDQYEKPTDNSLAMEKLEIEHIQHVQKQFDNLIKHIKECAEKNFTLCSKIIDKLEGILLNHKIRGKSIIEDTVMQVVNINDDLDEALTNFYQTDQDMSVPKSVENLLSQTRSGSIIDDDTFNIAHIGTETVEQHGDALYLQEMLALPAKTAPNLEKRKRSKLKTMKNAYHLVPSILNMCEEECETVIPKIEDAPKQETAITKYKKRQTLQETLLAMPKIEDPNKLLEVLETNHCNPESFMETTTSRWCNTIRSLQMMNCYQILLNGEIRISNKNKDETHTISSGGNFSPVILGLDATDRPLAVKRIRKDSSVCKIMKNLLNPLLGLRNTNLLHYFSCNYEENELVLATPLCEYNMGEYIMIMKQSPSLYITSIDIVKQFLAGLRFLHDRVEPIIHGNLKPSNIFIDLNGVVRIAEFGMHKALYTLIEAPNTSIIWFSRETFVAFKEISCITCTCASDIQVAGMLIHFMLTAGKHPYGEIMQDILKNLERATPQLATNDVDLHDLISWMLLYEPGERPSINQVLSHVFFWTIDRKWRFILTCSGVSSHGTPLNIPLNELHLYINLVAARENIKGRWINITKAKFPNLSYSKDDQDSITGLLRFIRNCMQNQVALHINSDLEFRNFILSSFPALPLSLYRILECSQWLNHRALQPFTTVDSLSA